MTENEVMDFSRETRTLEVASTSELIKLFHLTANAAIVWKRKIGPAFVADCQYVDADVQGLLTEQVAVGALIVFALK